jgi:hypothetical protein
MSKIKKEIAIFIVFITLVVLVGLKLPSNNTEPQYPPEPQVGGFTIFFKNGTTEPEVKAILENCDMILNYSIDFDPNNGEYKYYLEIHKDNIQDAIADGITKNKNWTDQELYILVKGDYCIFPITNNAIQDKNFLAILKKHNFQVKRFVMCLVNYKNQTNSHYIQENEVKIIERKLKMSEKVFYVIPEGLYYGSVTKNHDIGAKI